ncbi:MAG: protocatechuate 3,4-dioxygenase subunit alpha [Ardenticatenaceae bacterium]|nr:protocatechuate 3,4-dioxygenase subunit alpha [Ardenticatenaceae bacterium]
MASQSSSQTIGPFFHGALIRGKEHILISDQSEGERILIQGQLFDGDGHPVPDGMIEIWQADGRGFFNHPADPHRSQADPHFRGFGRAETTDGFTFYTIRPGIIPGHVVPFINVRIFARGMLIHAVTRIYFDDEKENENDPVLRLVPPHRRHTLLAVGEDGGRWPTFRFNIYLQGPRETVFFL